MSHFLFLVLGILLWTKKPISVPKLLNNLFYGESLSNGIITEYLAKVVESAQWMYGIKV